MNELKPSAPVTPNLIRWLLGGTQAQRGRDVQFRSTCPTFADWVLLSLGLVSAGKVELLLRVAYPEPTPVTVQLGLNLKHGPIANSITPKLYGFPTFTGFVPPLYSTLVGTAVIEWILAGATYSMLVDLGPNAVSIPACDQITVSYYAFALSPPAADSLSIGVSILPVAMPGSVATLTRQPVVVDPGVPVVSLFRQAWARRWKVTANQEPAAPPAPIGPVLVEVIDQFSLADTAEAVSFSDFTGTAGISAVNQGWIEVGGPALGYGINNLGATSIKAKIIEQLKVA